MEYKQYPPNMYQKKVGGRIKTGILLVAVGLLGGAIPTIGSIITVLILVGVILIFSGARDLSESYRRFSLISLLILFLMISLEFIAIYYIYSMIFGLSNVTSVPYSKLINSTDPFIFIMTIAYVLLGGSLILLSYPIWPKRTRIITWIVYIVSSSIFIIEAYFQISTLNTMYYQTLTLNNVGVYTSALNGIDAGAAIFMLIWASIFFLTYIYSRKMFPNIPPQYIQYQVAPQNTSEQVKQTGEIQQKEGILGTKSDENPSNTLSDQQNQNVQQAQSSSEQEVFLFSHPGAILLKIDDKVVSRPQYSGTIYITNRNFIFISKGKGGTASLMLGSAVGGIIQKGLSKVDIQEINRYLNSNGSFIISLSNISSISANVSLMLKGSFIKISTKVPVNPYGTKISGYNVEFTFLPKGYIGAAILKKEEAEYIKTTIANMVGK
ncbi:MAG: hypothetical protein C0180_03405 [Aciduliprofundum sp.]|nr:MAG: hypothetical protein C0180_03405 [Aciduliprofundum sp.]